MLNIGIVGRNHGMKHLKNIQRYHSNKALVKGLTYKDPSKASGLESEIQMYNSYKKMINEANLDALVLAGPHNLTREIIEFSADKIKFFLIEKPVAHNSAEIIKIKKILQEHNCTALIGHHRRFSPKVQELKRIIASGAIGNVISFDSVWCIKKNDEYFNNDEANWRIHAAKGGGPLAINGVHEIDTVRFLFGEIGLTKAILGKSNRRLAIEENITAIFKLENGIIGTLLIGDNIPSPFNYEKTMNENHSFPTSNVDFLKVFGDKGAITFPSLTLYPYEGSGDWFSMFSASSIDSKVVCEDPLKLEMDHFIRVIEGKDMPLVNIDDALSNMVVVDKIKQEIKNESVNL
ncbi:Gfo/Idh/MocA family protein [Azotobacter salinestris]|uniref:Gfo/Idh/MocA family protein n=1 Tax=Azotobacter salinestris TaxID=69964 RepID=UPI001266A466|nr:Gfo/Idh/MocA family oxidoreductase [Azotobacter salinestris]